MDSGKNKEIFDFILLQLSGLGDELELNFEEQNRLALFLSEAVVDDKFDLDLIDKDLLTRIKENGKYFGFLLNRINLEFFSISLKDGVDEKLCTQKLEKLKKISTKVEEIFNTVVWKDNSFVANDSFIYPSNSIIKSFEKMRDESESVEFINLYKGVPIVNRAKVVDIDGSRVAFKMENPLQEIAMKLDGKAFILKNDYITRYIKADIVYTNFLNDTVVLENFVYLLNMPAAQREYIRVHPDILAKVVLKRDDNVVIEGMLYDLSQSGLGVVSENNEGLFNDAEVYTSFELEEGDLLEVKGKIVNIIEYNGAYRYCIKIFPNLEQVDKIARYVEKRKNEILEDLKRELREYLL